MALTRQSGTPTLIDVLDRILDKGIVVDAWLRVSLVGIDLLTVEARVVLASFDTYLDFADTLALRQLVAAPPSIVPTPVEHGKGYSARSQPPTRLRTLLPEQVKFSHSN